MNKFHLTPLIIYGCVLNQTGANLAGIHLDAIAGNWPLITNVVLFAAIFSNRPHHVSLKHFMYGGKREGDIILPEQLTLNPSGTKISTSSKV